MAIVSRYVITCAIQNAKMNKQNWPLPTTVQYETNIGDEIHAKLGGFLFQALDFRSVILLHRSLVGFTSVGSPMSGREQ